MRPAPEARPVLIPGRFIAALVLARILLPLVLLAPPWEFHRDELLYFAMGDHLELRMQFPPFIAAVARLSSALLGDTVWAARVPAALAGGALTLVVLLLVRRLGGGRYAALTAWLALIAAPVFVRPSVLFQPVIFDQLWTALAVSALALAARDARPQRWVWVGVALGLGLLTKASAVMYGAVILGVTVVHPRLRSQLGTRWPWIAAALALFLGSPSVLGQVRHGWPFLAQLRVLEAGQLQHTSALGTVGGQLLLLGAASVLALAALGAAARSAVSGRDEGSAELQTEGLGVAAQVAALFAVGLLATVLWRGGKDYYAAPGHPVLLAIGAVWLTERLGRVGRAGLLLGLGAGAIVLLPLGIPLLRPEAMVRYSAWIGAGTRTNQGGTLALPQDYADMLGWHRQAEAVAEVYRGLTPGDQLVTTIAGGNYGQTGALAMYRHRYHLPYPVSSAGDFHAWGPGERRGDVLIVAASPDALPDLERLYAEVEVVRRLTDERRVSEEQEVHIFLCRRPRAPIAEVWPSIGPEWD